MTNKYAQSVTHIVDSPQNVKLLMQSDELLSVRLLPGKAQKILNLSKEFTGWYSRELANDALCFTTGGGYLIFRINPLVIKRFDAHKTPNRAAYTYAQCYAIDNSITEQAQEEA